MRKDVIIESCDLVENETKLEIVFRKPSNSMYACNPPRPVPDKVWKQVFGVLNDKIVLLEEIKGKHIPSHLVEESIEFD